MSDYRHEENQRRFDNIEKRIGDLEEQVIDIKLLLAKQQGQWSTIKWLLGLGALLLGSNFVITLLNRVVGIG